VVVVITIVFGLISFNVLLGDNGASKRLREYKSELSEIKKTMEITRSRIVAKERYIELARRSLEFYEPQIGKQDIKDHYRQDIDGGNRDIEQYEHELDDLGHRRTEVEALISKYEQCIADKKC
jgi:chromosome segregation ATPase